MFKSKRKYKIDKSFKKMFKGKFKIYDNIQQPFQVLFINILNCLVNHERAKDIEFEVGYHDLVRTYCYYIKVESIKTIYAFIWGQGQKLENIKVYVFNTLELPKYGLGIMIKDKKQTTSIKIKSLDCFYIAEIIIGDVIVEEIKKELKEK